MLYIYKLVITRPPSELMEIIYFKGLFSKIAFETLRFCVEINNFHLISVFNSNYIYNN